MTTFRNWKIQTKLSLIIGAFLLVLGTYAGISMYTRGQLQIDGPFYTRIVQTKQLLTDIAPSPLNLNEVELIAQQAAAATDVGQRNAYIRKLHDLRKSFEESHTQWQQLLASDPNQTLKQALLFKAHEPAVRFLNLMDTVFIPAVESGDRAKATAILTGPMQREFAAHRLGIEEAMRLAEAENTKVHQEALELIASRTFLQRCLLVGSLLGFILAGRMLMLSIARPLRGTVTALATTSVQLATTIEEHERTAMNQSAAVNQTTSAMDELDASFSQTAEVIRAAADRVQQSVQVANEGIRTVKQMQEGMADLKTKVGTTVAGQILTLSEQIAQINTITNQVSDLASQTNMLALNAAVEAARAGEHGKGFAVVAAEIRKLADASRKSAERISTLLDDIQKATNATVMATEESAKSVDQAIRRAEATVSIFDELKDASNSAADAAQQTLLSVPQQVTAVRQVLESMDALNRGARETADSISQSRIGSETLRGAVERLRSTI